MIDHDEVLRLLAEGNTQYRVAKMLDISPTTVYKIKAGRYTAPVQPMPKRCRGCGAMVIHPCLACQLRKKPK